MTDEDMNYVMTGMLVTDLSVLCNYSLLCKVVVQAVRCTVQLYVESTTQWHSYFTEFINNV